MKLPCPFEGSSATEVMAADSQRVKKVAEAEAIREANLQATGKRLIKGALDVTLLPKKPKGPDDDVAVLDARDEA